MSRTFTHDHELIDQLMQDDTVAFEELYRRYWYSLYSYSYSKLQSHEQSKLIVKKLFVELWNQRAELPVSFSLNTYLYAELRKEVLYALSEQLEEAAVIPQLKEFDVSQLNKARVPVRRMDDVAFIPQQTVSHQKASPHFSMDRYISFFTFHQWKKALQSMLP